MWRAWGSKALLEVTDGWYGMALLTVREVAKAYGEVPVLNGVSFSLTRGENMVLIGPSGGGKSTLLRCIMGIERIDEGEIDVAGAPYIRTEKGRKYLDRNIKRKIAMVFQHYNLFPHLTVLRNCTLAPTRVLGMSEKEASQHAKQVLESVGLKEKIHSYPSTLSGGQQQRAAIARSLTMEPELMLFDEITSALDPELIKGILDLLADLARSGMTMLNVTHEMAFALDIGSEVIFLDGGKILDEGPAQDVICHPTNERTQRFLEHFNFSTRS